MRYKLTKYEQETIVLMNRADKEAIIFTYDPKLKRRLHVFSQNNPEVCRRESINLYGGESYVINKDRLSLRFLTSLSDKRRNQAMIRVKEKQSGMIGNSGVIEGGMS